MSEQMEKSAIVNEKEKKKQEKLAKKEQKKLEKQAKGGKDGLIIGVIVALVIIIALAIFGYFLYNKNLKAVVKFDGGYVSTSDYEIYYRTFAPMLEYMYGYSVEDDAEAIGEIIAQKAASDMIIVSKAKEAGIKISDEDKAYVDEIFADEEELALFTQSGIDPIRMQQFYYNDFIMDDYKTYLAEKLPAEEVNAFLKETYGEDVDMREYVTKHILFSKLNESGKELAEEEKAKVKTEAQAVLQRALNGEDFTKLVTEFSDDTATAKKGGEYKVYVDDRTVEEYINAVITMKPNEIKPELVETDYGYHIIMLVEYNENGRTNSLSERETMISDELSALTEGANIEIQTQNMKEVISAVSGVSLDEEKNETEVDTYSAEEHDHEHTEITVE